MEIKDILEINKSKLINGKDGVIEHFTINTKDIKGKTMFIPLQGNTDGHNYILDGVKNGISGFLVMPGHDDIVKEALKINKDLIIVEVPDCLKALQDLAKDIIAGMGIILENQYAMGDTISINGFKGEVVFLGLKTTRIKSWEGEVKILANRNITEVINYSISSSLAIVDVGVNYNEDLDKVEEVLNTLASDLTKKLPKLKGEVEVLGIDKFSDSALIYRLIVPTVSMEHYGVARQIRKEIILCFEKNNINIPYNQIEVHHGK